MNPAIKSAGCFLFLLALCFFPVTDAAGMSFERDASNRIETVVDSFGRNVTYKLDADGQESFWTYDDRGNKLTETDPLENGGGDVLNLGVGPLCQFNCRKL